MNTKETTPPKNCDIRKVFFPYDEEKFAKTISKIKETLLPDIKVSVFASDSSGNMINILESNLSGETLDVLCSQAAYTMYEGHYLDLQKIGIV